MIDFEKTSLELQEDTKIDELNLLQKQLMLPAIKHKWVARLIQQKRHLNQLERKKKVFKIDAMAKLEGQIPPGMPRAALEKKLNSAGSVTEIDAEIEETQIAIEYLEKVEQIMRSMTYDLKNIIEITRLETT